MGLAGTLALPIGAPVGKILALRGVRRTLCFLFILLFALASSAQAARIDDIVTTDVWEQAARFFLFRDESLRLALLGSLLLGVSCGLLGSFIVVRKMALVGDALSHAVLPGVAAGFLWNMEKDPVAIFIGATIAGLIGSACVNWITRTTRLKEDAALGLVLASFFALGVCMISMIQRLPAGNQSGVDKFLFGQAAALSAEDVRLMAITCGASLLLVTALFKEFLVISFDAVYARTIGLPVRWLQELFMLLLAFSIVVALQAVGVVLVSAMLITPAASAYLLTDRLHRMLVLSALFGLASGALGAFLSFLGNNLPTGPFMVVSASVFFGGAFLFAPRHGVVPRWWRHRSRAQRIERENLLKSIYRVVEDRSEAEQGEGVSLGELAQLRKTTLEEVEKSVVRLRDHGLATLDRLTGDVHLTPAGWRRASTIVRNHRLWELYLTNAVDYPADHVHDDAERIEHILGEEIVRQLERRLEFPSKDPHGRAIPTIRETQERAAKTGASGYSRRS